MVNLQTRTERRANTKTPDRTNQAQKNQSKLQQLSRPHAHGTRTRTRTRRVRQKGGTGSHRTAADLAFTLDGLL
jgi:hypothetical protein